MADPISIPTTADEPYYSQVTDLDGRSYLLSFAYQQRFDRWVLAIGTAEGEPVIQGIRLMPGADLLEPYRYLDDAPPGELRVLTFGDDDSPPGFGELGIGLRCELVYIPATEA